MSNTDSGPQFALTELTGRVAVVTGGASGIGKGIAQRLVAEGMRVVVSDLDAEALAQTADELGAFGVRADVTDPDQVQALADATVERYGTAHLLINNAGVSPFATVAEMTLADWRWMVDVNLFGVIHGIHAFLPILSGNGEGGFIVNTASMAGLTTTAGIGMAAYTAGKAAVIGITEILVKELAAAGTQVGASVLCPGPVRSRITESLRARPAGERGALFDPDPRATGDKFAAMRVLEPADVAELVVSAVGKGDPYIITHPELWPVVAARFQAVASAFGTTLRA